MYSKITLKFTLVIGPPQSFCYLRDNGQYTNPDNEQQFFTCTDNIGSACQMCPGNLVFKAKCGQCLEVNIDCAMTTAKPTAKNPTAATNKATVTTANGSGTTTKPSTRCMYSSTYLYSNTKFVSVNANNWFNNLSFLLENLLLFIQVHLQHFVTKNHLESMQTQTTNNNFLIASTALVKYVKRVQEIWFLKLNVVNVWKLILTVQRQLNQQ